MVLACPLTPALSRKGMERQGGLTPPGLQTKLPGMDQAAITRNLVSSYIAVCWQAVVLDMETTGVGAPTASYRWPPDRWTPESSAEQ